MPQGVRRWVNVLLGIMLLLCAAAVGTVLYRSTPMGMQAAENEIVEFMRELILTQGIGSMADYIETSGQPWVEAAPRANIIVYGRILSDDYGGYRVDSEHPIRVWWLEGNELTDVAEGDRAEAIARYQEQYIDPLFDESTIFAWGAYDFGIVDIGLGGMTARVYTSSSCGPLCGSGFTFDMVRLPSGRWIIVREEMLWIS
jgi:hypothetical protein